MSYLDKKCCLVTQIKSLVQWVTLAFSLNKEEREISQRSHSFLLKKTNEGEIGNGHTYQTNL